MTAFYTSDSRRLEKGKWKLQRRNMLTDYDPIAEQYKRSKLTPWRTHIESFVLLELIGPVGGRAVLGVGCGEGFYTRMLKLRGAGRITGLDLSDGMIELARTQEVASPVGVEFVVGDGRALPYREEFDLVVAGYLLNYARDRKELRAMCGGIASALKPGGRFVAVNSSPALDFRKAPSYRQYGFETTVTGAWSEGAPITWTFYLDDGPFSIENYYLDVAIHEEALKEAGFRSVRWHTPRVASKGIEEEGEAFWEPFLTAPPVTF